MRAATVSLRAALEDQGAAWGHLRTLLRQLIYGEKYSRVLQGTEPQQSYYYANTNTKFQIKLHQFKFCNLVHKDVGAQHRTRLRVLFGDFCSGTYLLHMHREKSKADSIQVQIISVTFLPESLFLTLY